MEERENLTKVLQQDVQEMQEALAHKSELVLDLSQ